MMILFSIYVALIHSHHFVRRKACLALTSVRRNQLKTEGNALDHAGGRWTQTGNQVVCSPSYRTAAPDRRRQCYEQKVRTCQVQDRAKGGRDP